MGKYLCMEVGTSCVRLVEVVRSGKKIKIKGIHVFDTPDDATKDGKVRQQDDIVAAIRDGIDRSGVTAQDVYFSVESSRVLLKRLDDVPQMNAKEIQGYLDNQFEEMYPVDPKFYHIAFRVIRKYKKNGADMMSLEVYAVPNDLSQSYYDLSVALNLNAKSLSTTVGGISSLFPEIARENNALINIGESTTTISIFADGEIQMSKTIQHGVISAVQRVMASDLTRDDISYKEAVEQLCAQNVLMRALPTNVSTAATDVEKLQYEVTASIARTIKEIQMELYAMLQKRTVPLQNIYLSGIGAGFAGISQLMTSIVENVPVRIVQDDGSLEISGEAATDVLLISCFPAIGSMTDKINFFTKEEQAGGDLARKRKITRAMILTGFAALVASLTYSGMSYITAQSNLLEQKEMKAQLENQIKILEDLGVRTHYNNYVTATSYNEEVKKIYNSTKSGNEDMTVFLEELESVVPQSAIVTGMTLSPKNATITFVCENREIAAGLLHRLRNMKTSKNFDCAGVGEVAGEDVVTFTGAFTLLSTAERAGLTINENGDYVDANGNVVDLNEWEPYVPESEETQPDGETEAGENAEGPENGSENQNENTQEPTGQPTEQETQPTGESQQPTENGTEGTSEPDTTT